ncbi:hypothetical protein [Mycolicibacter heraklionensis]|uniref:hypothetical protein n=1 Tax=Mycolicibacter heraklionensis TaxID=512402 RepID=UPI0010424866|nr:hypothetical protein [Mycolicibacter heraklionensis]
MAGVVLTPLASAAPALSPPQVWNTPVSLTALPDASEVAQAVEALAKTLHWIYIDAGYPGTTPADTHDLAETIVLNAYNYGYTTDQLINIVNTGGPQNILLELHDYSPASVFEYYDDYFTRWIAYFPNAHLPDPNDSVPLPDLEDEIGQSGDPGMYSEAADHFGILYPLVRDIGTFLHALPDDPILGSGALGFFSWGVTTGWDFMMYGYYGTIGLDQQPIDEQLDGDLNALIGLVSPVTAIEDAVAFFDHTGDLFNGTMTADGFGEWSGEFIAILLSVL